MRIFVEQKGNKTKTLKKMGFENTKYGKECKGFQVTKEEFLSSLEPIFDGENTCDIITTFNKAKDSVSVTIEIWKDFEGRVETVDVSVTDAMCHELNKQYKTVDGALKAVNKFLDSAVYIIED